MRDCDQCNNDPRKAVRVKTFSDGRPQYCYQCLDCGLRVGTWLAKTHPDVLALAERVPFDEAAEEAYHERRRQYWEQKRLERAAAYEAQQAAFTDARSQENAEWRAKYTAYIASSAWRAKADLVLKRAGYVCEGCGVNRATQVHHLSYDHLGNEFLWELRAVCRPCHARWHNKDQDHAA